MKNLASIIIISLLISCGNKTKSIELDAQIDYISDTMVHLSSKYEGKDLLFQVPLNEVSKEEMKEGKMKIVYSKSSEEFTSKSFQIQNNGKPKPNYRQVSNMVNDTTPQIHIKNHILQFSEEKDVIITNDGFYFNNSENSRAGATIQIMKGYIWETKIFPSSRIHKIVCKKVYDDFLKNLPPSTSSGPIVYSHYNDTLVTSTVSNSGIITTDSFFMVSNLGTNSHRHYKQININLNQNNNQN